MIEAYSIGSVLGSERSSAWKLAWILGGLCECISFGVLKLMHFLEWHLTRNHMSVEGHAKGSTCFINVAMAASFKVQLLGAEWWIRPFRTVYKP